MKAYVTTSANVTGVFPNTLAKNSSTGVSTDGTPLVADYTNDLWPLMQCLMDRVGQTPSGTIEAYTAVGTGSAAGLGQTVNDPAQQHISSLARNFAAAGEIVFDVVNGSALSRRVVQLQGQVLDGYLYPDLVFNTWVGAGSNGSATGFYTTSDSGGSTRATTGLTINGVTSGRYLVLPDYRGLSPIGLGVNTKFQLNTSPNVFPTGGATLAAYLADKMQGHYHQQYNNTTGGAATRYNTPTGGGSLTGLTSIVDGSTVAQAISDGTNGTPRTGLYTNGPGFACNIGVRY